MPDTIRISGGLRSSVATRVLERHCGRRVPLPRQRRAKAGSRAARARGQRPSTASTGMKSPCWSLMLGLVLFAVVTAIMLVRARARWARLETSSRDEIATLRSDLDRANALLLSEPQVMVDWPAALRRAAASTAIPASSALPRRIACSPSAPGSKPARLSPWNTRSKLCAAAAKAFRMTLDHAARPPDRSRKAAPSAAAPCCG